MEPETKTETVEPFQLGRNFAEMVNEQVKEAIKELNFDKHDEEAFWHGFRLTV